MLAFYLVRLVLLILIYSGGAKLSRGEGLGFALAAAVIAVIYIGILGLASCAIGVSGRHHSQFEGVWMLVSLIVMITGFVGSMKTFQVLSRAEVKLQSQTRED